MKIEGLVEGWLHDAVRVGASDLHIEPFEDLVRIRRRVAAGLHTVAQVSVHLKELIVAHLKALAQLDVGQTRKPQDGRIAWLRQGARALDLRLATVPSVFGETAVIRFLNGSSRGLELDELGLSQKIHTELLELSHQQEGMLLVTGPTGSGKTTTLYALLQALTRPSSVEAFRPKKILTIEDPVEYTYDALFQVAVKPQIGLTFATGLRAFLRHDPDVIMVGELRDAETASLAAQAAFTGQLVLSTLHTRDAQSAPLRLLQLGVPLHHVRSVLLGVLAQTLVLGPSGQRSGRFDWLCGPDLAQAVAHAGRGCA